MFKNTRYRRMFSDGIPMPILTYNPVEAGLTDWAKSVFEINELENLHLLPDPIVFKNYVERLYFRVNQLKSNIEMIREAITIIKNKLLVPFVGEIQRFQFPPSIRCHLSGAGTASAFHKDGELKYGVAPNTLNLWIPLTRAWGNNSIHIEQGINSGKFRAVTLSPGEILIFDAFNLTHGSYANDTIATRVSIDIRFVPKDIRIAQKLGIYADSALSCC